MAYLARKLVEAGSIRERAQRVAQAICDDEGRTTVDAGDRRAAWRFVKMLDAALAASDPMPARTKP